MRLSLKVVIDEEIAARPQGKEMIKESIQDLSSTYRSQFGIDFEVVEWLTWNPPYHASTLPEVAEALSRSISLNSTDLVIGIVSMENSNDSYNGFADFFGSLALIKDKKDVFSNTLLLAHECGHLLGAVHQQDSNSVMFSDPLVRGSLRFDPENSQIIKMAKSVVKTEQSPDKDILGQLYLRYQRIHEQYPASGAKSAFTSLVARIRPSSHALSSAAWRFASQSGPAGSGIALSPQASAQQAFSRGNIYQERGQWEQAAHAYKEAIQENGDFVQASVNLANGYQSQGKVSQAIDEYQRALRICKQQGASDEIMYAIYFNMAQAQMKTGQYEKAENSYSKAIRYNPQDGSAYRNLGLLYFQKLNNSGKARKFLQKSLSINPHQSQSIQLHALIERLS